MAEACPYQLALTACDDQFANTGTVGARRVLLLSKASRSLSVRRWHVHVQIDTIQQAARNALLILLDLFFRAPVKMARVSVIPELHPCVAFLPHVRVIRKRYPEALRLRTASDLAGT
jgi:hypothetical protein